IASRETSLQTRSATKPAYGVVEDLNVGALSFTTDGSGNVVNPGANYQGSISAFITRTGTGVYSVQTPRSFPDGTVFLAVSTAATGSAVAALGASPNIITITTYAAAAAANVVSGTVTLFY